jgi:NAD(P)-dependent dehydrogenase (short-subunit alcohol dehydrogenase family)
MQLQGQAALVTGGASGLGAETVRQLVQAGARVSILDVNIEAAQALADELRCHAVRCDITDSASVTAALDAAQKPTAHRASSSTAPASAAPSAWSARMAARCRWRTSAASSTST